MNKLKWYAGVLGLMHVLISAPSSAQDRSSGRLVACTRDLGSGVNVLANPAYSNEGKLIGATLRFRYWDGELAILPERLTFRGLPNGSTFKPANARSQQHPLEESDSGVTYSQSLHIDFPNQSSTVENVDFIFGSKTLSKDGRAVDITPFKFNESQRLLPGEPQPKATYCMSAAPIPESATAQFRMKSCDPKVAMAAAEEIINDPTILDEPLNLFIPASVLYGFGKKDEAVFWFYAAQLRLRQQLIFENGDRGQLLQVMLMTVGVPINNYAFQDISNFSRILDKVLEWDMKTANPFRGKSNSADIQKKIEQVYAGYRDLKIKINREKSELEEQARKAATSIELAYAQSNNQLCRKG